MNKTKKILKFIVIVSIALTSFNLVHASSELELGFQVGKVDEIDEDGYPIRIDSALENNSVVELGDLLQLDFVFNNFEGSMASLLQGGIRFDHELVELLAVDGEIVLDPFDKTDLPFFHNWRSGRNEYISHELDTNFHGNNQFYYTVKTTPNATEEKVFLLAPEDNRLFSIYFRVTDDELKKGEDIEFIMPALNGFGTAAQVVADNKAGTLPSKILNDGKLTFRIAGGEPEPEKAEVAGITATGTVNGTEYDYFEGLFEAEKEDYTNNVMVVPNALEQLTFDFDTVGLENETVETYKVATNNRNDYVQIQSNVGNIVNLHVGDNHFRSIIKDGNDVVGDFSFSVKRLSSMNEHVLSYGPQGTSFPDSNEIKFKHGDSNVDLKVNVKADDQYTYLGNQYPNPAYRSNAKIELIVDGTTIKEGTTGWDYSFDVSDTSKNEFEIGIKVTPEDALHEGSVPGNTPSDASEIITYKLIRESNEANLTSVKLFDGATHIDESSYDESNRKYIYNVSSDVTSVKLDLVASDKATINKKGQNLDDVKLTSASTEVTVDVKSEDGSVTNTYTFVINKAAKTSAELENLNIVLKNGSENITPSFEFGKVIDLGELDYSDNYTINLSPVLKNDGSYIADESQNNVNKDITLNPGTHEFEIKVFAEDKTTFETYTVKVKVKNNSSSDIDEGGVDIDIDEGDLDPENPIVPGEETEEEGNKVYNYTINVKYNKDKFAQDDLKLTLPVGATATYPNPSTIDLNVGANGPYDVKVTSADGSSTSIYRFTINRAQNTETNLDINVITDPAATVTKDDKYNYTVKVDASVTTYKLDVMLKDGTTIESGYEKDKVYDLTTSDQVHTIKAKSQSGEVEDYTITFDRATSSDASLKNLLIEYKDEAGLDILGDFNNNVQNITIDSSWIKFNPVVNHPSATVLVNGKSIDTEFEVKHDITNTFNIVVKAEDGKTEVSYIVQIKRTPSDNANLDKIEYVTLDGVSIQIPNLASYTVNEDKSDYYAEDVENIVFNVFKSDETSTVEILNNGVKVHTIVKGVKNETITVPLNTGKNEIKFNVKAHNEQATKEYTVVVNKVLSSDVDVEVKSKDVAKTLTDFGEYTFDLAVPLETKSVNQENDLVITKKDGQTIEWITSTVDIQEGQAEPLSFKVIAENGSAEQIYTIHISVMQATYPYLDNIKINGKDLVGFKDNNQLKDQTILVNLDDYVNQNNPNFVIIADFGNRDYTITPTDVAIIDTLGQSKDIIHKIILTDDAGYTNFYELNMSKTLSSNAYLSDLIVGDLEFEFEKDKNKYEFSVDKDVESITIGATKEDNTSSVTGAKEYDLEPGTNKMVVRVVAEHGTPNEYFVDVFKEFGLETLKLDNIDLLTSGDVTRTTEENKLIYTINTPFNATKTTVDLSATSQKGVTVGAPANSNVNLDASGTITFDLTTKGEDTITVEIHYKRDASKDATLKSPLTLFDKEIVIKPSEFEYEIELDAEYTTVKFDDFKNVETNHIHAKAEGSGSLAIEHGQDNIYKITVTAEDGTTQKVYNIKISRGAYNYLEDLRIEAGKGHFYYAFDKTKPEHEALIYNNVETFSFEWETQEGVVVTNAEDLKNIKVTEDIVNKEFVIKVKDGEHVDIREYKVTIDLGVSLRLKSMKTAIGVLTPEFDAANRSYKVYVPNDTNEVEMYDIFAEDDNATVLVNGTEINKGVGKHTITLNSTTTSVEVRVNNKGESDHYTVVFYKVSDQTTIGNITANDGSKIWTSTKDGQTFEILVDNGVDISKLNYNVNLEYNGGTYVLSEGEDISEPTDTISTYKYTVTVKDSFGITKEYELIVKNDLSDNNYLEYIKVNGNLVAGFNRYAEEYSYHINYDEEFVISAKAEHEDSSTVVISNYDKNNVTDGQVITITVTSAKNTQKVYKVTVSKTKENFAILDDLYLIEAAISPSFDKLIDEYYTTVPYELSKVSVGYVYTHNGSVKLLTSNKENVVDLIPGDNTIEVEVTAESGDKFVYTINVKRNAKANNTLEDLSVWNGQEEIEINFSPETLVYNVKVPTEVDTVQVEAEYDENRLTVSGLGGVSLNKEGLTVRQVTVIENGIPRVYTLTIVKEASNIAYLKNLETDSKVALVPEFDPEQIVYQLSVKHDVDSIVVTGTPNEKSSVVGDGEVSLVPGKNNVTITVTAEDGVTQRSYTIVVNRDLELLSLNIGDKDYTAKRTKTVDGTYKYILDDKIDSNTTQSMITPKFNHGSISYEGLANAKTIEESGIIKFTMTARDEATSYDVEVSYERELSSDATVESINIAGQEITLGVYGYSIEVPYNFETLHKNNVIVKTRHANASFDAPESMDIEFSKDNIYSITVTSEDGSNTEVYNVNIQRKNYEEGPSTLLNSLAVNPGNIDFISENLTYKVKVAKNVSQVTVSEILPVDPNADVSAAYAIENNTLVADITHDRYVKITVMNEGNVSVYTLEFIQTESETSIKDVNGNDGDKIFKGELNEETGNIEIEVDYDTEIDENFELDIDLDFPGGKVDIDGPNINGDGDYEYTVTVEDENGNQEDHTIVIKKDKNSNAYLKELALFGENLVGFNKHTENYEYTIEAGQDVILTDVTYKTEDEDASAEASMDGDIITIVVTAQNKTTKTYTVTIIEKVDNQALLYGLGLLEVGISPSFNRNESRYFASVPNEFEAVTVVIGAADGVETKITSDRTVNDRKVSDLEVGPNRIDIEVSLDEIVYTYTIFVERQQASNSNYLDSLQVFDLIDEGKEYTLSPSFSKDTQFYTVEVPYDASSFEIKGSFDESLTVSGLDTLVIQDFLYIHKVRVADENGVVREYALQIVKAESNNTYLDDLAVSEGIMSPVFEKDVTHYNVDVGSDIDSIEITYTKGSEDQIVTGDGKKDLVFGRNTFTVKVESGSKVQEYTIYVYRDNVPPKLTSLSISEGELTPEFDPDKYVYRAFVGSEIDSVDITAESNHEVSGDIGTQTLKKGDNIFEIKVTDGAKESSYYIIVYRESDNSDSDDSFFQGNVDLAYLNIPNEEMNETFSSDLLEYTATLKDPYYGELNIIAVPRNPKANVAISGHTDLGNGVHDILITVSLKNGKSQTTTITVTIDDYYLQSDIHDIGETYILTIREKQTVLDVKNQMLNENEYLIISQNGEHLNDDDIVGTGAIIRLVVEDKEHDSKVLIVKGDVNGDGEVGVPDRMQAQSKVLGNDLTEVQMLAADVTNDDEIAINDVMLIQAHVLEIENLYEMEEE